MKDQNASKLRILAILDYDEVPQGGQLGHLMCCCDLSRYLALKAMSGVLPRDSVKVWGIADSLDVDFEWLLTGVAGKWHPRTFRIHAQHIHRYPKPLTDQMVRLLVAATGGHRKAGNLLGLVNSSKMSLIDAARSM